MVEKQHRFFDLVHAQGLLNQTLIYMLKWKRCLNKDQTLPSQFIGQTGRSLGERSSEHRRGIQNNKNEFVPIHFNLPYNVGLIPLLTIKNG